MAFYKYYMGVNQHSKTREISSDVIQVMLDRRGRWQWCIPEDIVWLATGTRRRASHLTSLRSQLRWWLVTHGKAFLTENLTWRRAAPLDTPQTPSSSFHICSATVLSFVEHIYIFIPSLIYLCSAAQHPELLTVPPPYTPTCGAQPFSVYCPRTYPNTHTIYKTLFSLL